MNMKWRMFFILLVVVFGAMSVIPNFVEIPEDSFLSNKSVVYGLDIQGGLHLVMGVDVREVIKEQTKRDAVSLKDYLTEQGANVVSVAPQQAGTREDIVIQTSSVDEVKRLITQDWTSYLIIDDTPSSVSIRKNEVSLGDLKKRTVDQAIETIRNRIDEFGVAEPSITAQGDDRILVQLPGIEDSTKAKELINRTARLTFMLVAKDNNPAELGGWITEAEKAGDYDIKKTSYREYVKRINVDLKDKLKDNQMVLFSRAENAEDLETGKVPYLVEKTSLGGDDLRDAFVAMGEFNEPEISLTFNPEGARKFAEITGENVGRQLAIVLDDVIYSAPNIQGKIPGGRGRITLGGGRNYEAMMEEARTISMALRAGALPAKLEQLEERTVGPTLGADSIAKGKKAILIGGVLVICFMLFYYKVFGLLANLALGLNMFLILAVLTSLEATLTLPGIAGIALTIGMAVDANVIIFERIKEELKKGSALAVAIREGYSKGFSAIFDANITTAATSIILMYFGTGPVRGFAVTLLIGIITSVFTAVFVTRTVLEYIVGRSKIEKLAI